MKLNQYAFVSVLSLAIIGSECAQASIFDDIKASINNATESLHKQATQARIKDYESIQDKKLVDTFYKFDADSPKLFIASDLAEIKPKITIEKLTPSSIVMSFVMYKSDTMAEMEAAMSKYVYSAEDDAIGKKYVGIAHGRGNVVKKFRPALGYEINNIFEQNFKFTQGQGFRNWINTDNVLIEYDPSGSIVSFMTRAHQASIGFGILSRQYVNIYFGQGNSRTLENKISINTFENNLISVIQGEKTISNLPNVESKQESKQSSSQAQPSIIQNNQENNLVPKASGTVLLITPDKPDTLMAQQGDDLVPLSPQKGEEISPEKRLKLLTQLVELKKAGALTEQEFTTEKQRILSK